jgi:hypothetical protein
MTNLLLYFLCALGGAAFLGGIGIGVYCLLPSSIREKIKNYHDED